MRKRNKRNVAEKEAFTDTIISDTHMDIKGTHWLAKIKPLLEMFQELEKVQNDSLRKSLKGKLGSWVGCEWLDVPQTEPSQLFGDPSLIEMIENAKTKMKQIIIDAEVREEIDRNFRKPLRS